MVKIRLTRLGRHKKPFYRIVAIDSRKRRDSEYLCLLGTLDTLSNKVSLDEEKTLEFLKKGAQPSESVESILKAKGVWAKFLASKPAKKPAAKKAKKPAAKKEA